MFVGNAFVGIEGYEEFRAVCACRLQDCRQLLQGDELFFFPVGSGIDMEFLVDGDTCHSLRRGLLLALRQIDFDGIGRNHRAGNHEEDEQQEDDVGHRRHIERRGYFGSAVKRHGEKIN